ncbi:MAG: DUF1214 domain-containing protein [Acidimicrobiia bacterium]|nr:DUF1214 domain-containing protein [Acidimicrobiia bacterium]
MQDPSAPRDLDNQSGVATGVAVRDLLALLSSLEARFTAGDPAIPDGRSLLEAYRWIFSILQVGTDAHLWADAQRPRFIDIVGPYKKWGGDNADAFYQYAPIDPARTYRVRARRGDAVYFSLTVYGGPDDGRYSERIVGTANDLDALPDADGTIQITLSPHHHDGAWIQLNGDAVCAITRDYMIDADTGQRMQWKIECIDGEGKPNLTDEETARRFRAVHTWIEEQVKITPLAQGAPNVVETPYPVPTTTFGWAAGDAAYAMGSFELAENEALVIRGRSPECAFWNLCLWNPFLHTYNYDYDRVTINGAQVVYETDGSWVIVVAARDPGHPNWVSTQGHRQGRLWFRWFRPDATPECPSTEVVELTGQ